MFCLCLKLVDYKQNLCMNFIIDKDPCDIAIFLSEVCVRILTNQLISISNDISRMIGEYGLSKLSEKGNLFLDYSFIFICPFYFDHICKLLKPSGFQYMNEKFVPDVDYWAKRFKIIKYYLEFVLKSLVNKYTYENIFAYTEENSE